MKPRAAVTIQPRFRILAGKDIALGPGKADLLEEVAWSGSISEAAERLGMSYMRAWTLVKTMERCFRQPLVTASRGGAGHGGAQLTANGRRVLELYRQMESKSLSATASIQQQLVKMLRS